jgi:hypothetical protein
MLAVVLGLVGILLLLPLVLPLAARTPRRLLAVDLALAALILALWNWGSVELERNPGSGEGFGAAIGVSLLLTMTAGLALGTLLRLLGFGLQASKGRGGDTGLGRAWLFALLIPLAFAPRAWALVGKPYDWRDFRTVPHPVHAALKIAETRWSPWRTTTVLALVCTDGKDVRLLERTDLAGPKPDPLPYRFEAALYDGRDTHDPVRLRADVVAVGAADTIVSMPLSSFDLDQLAQKVTRPALEVDVMGDERGAIARSIVGSAEIRAFAGACR